MQYLIAVQSDVGCEGEGNDLEEGFHTKDSCDASIQSIDDLSHTKSSCTCSSSIHTKAMACLSFHDTCTIVFLPRTAYASTGQK